MRRMLRLVIALFVAFSILHPAAAREPGDWLNHDLLRQALAEHPSKTPQNLEANLDFATQRDGSLRVIVALNARTTEVERAMERRVRRLQWYGDGPRFFGLVDQEGFARLLSHPAVDFVEPDHELTYFLSTSVVDVNARGPNGIWEFDAAGSALGTLRSSVEGRGVDAVTGKGVTVAVVDSGIDKTHRDFGGWDCKPGPYAPCESRIVKAVSVEHLPTAPPDPADRLPTTEFVSGHGTHVAGIVAGNGYYARDGEADPRFYGGDGYVIGMAPQASLVSVKVGDAISAAFGTTALQWTLDHVDDFEIRVTNNSWGCARGCEYNPNSVLAQIQKDLYESGVVTVFAAGNSSGSGSGAELSGNSQSPYVLSVASYDDETGNLSSFSSRGTSGTGLHDPATWTPEAEGTNPPRRPDIAAPGDWIHSAASLTGGAASIFPRVDPKDAGLQPGIFAYTGMGGTSMAAPHVAGAAALVIGACPGVRPLHVMQALMAGAAREKIRKSDGGGVAEPFEVGYGGLDVAASLRWLRAGVCDGHFGRIEGSVRDARSGGALAGARVECAGMAPAVADDAGEFAIEAAAVGTHDCTASMARYRATTRAISIEPNVTTDADFDLNKKGRRRKG